MCIRGIGPLLLAALSLTAGDAMAQRSQTLRGTVRDSVTQQAIASAWIEVQALSIRVASGERGAFAVSLPAGEHRLTVHAWGYRSAEQRIVVPDSQNVTVWLVPRPLAATPIIAAAEANLERRRRSAPWSVGVLSREDIERIGPLPAVDGLVRRHITLFPCEPRPQQCIRRRGQVIRPIVCIDEREPLGGIAELRSYPLTMFHSIEVHDGGMLIRGYTTRFMDHLLAGRVRLMPVVLRNRC